MAATAAKSTLVRPGQQDGTGQAGDKSGQDGVAGGITLPEDLQ